MRLLPNHPVANSRVGIEFFKAGNYLEAIPYLDRARRAEPTSFWHWGRLITAYRRAGLVDVSNQLLAQMKSSSFKSRLVTVLGELLNQPDERRQQALIELRNSPDLLKAEIAARLFIEDYPDHVLGQEVLKEVLQNQAVGRAL